MAEDETMDVDMDLECAGEDFDLEEADEGTSICTTFLKNFRARGGRF